MLSSYAVRKSVHLILISLLFVASAIPCFAVSMKATGGFDSVTKTTSWTPITVELENTGNRTVKGVLQVVQASYSTPYCAARVELPGDSKKRYHVYARLREYGDVRVILRDGDSVVADQKLNLNFTDPKDALVVSVGGRSSQLSFLNREALMGAASARSGNMISVGSIPADSLPDRPAAYDGVDVLVLSGLPQRALSPEASDAIGMWVASGGILVVSTGADYRSYQNSFYDELLPVKITGSGSVTQSARLSAAGGVPFPAGAMAVATSTPKAGIASDVIAESGIPLFAERRYGTGRVIFLAFDHRSAPFKDWNGQTQFWKNIISVGSDTPLVQARGGVLLRSHHYGGYYDQDPSQDSFPYIVQQNQSIKMPSFTTIILFLLGYIVVLVPVNYFVLHRMRRRELAWVTTPVIILVFTVGAYGIGYTMKGGRLQINEASFVEATSNARYARMLTEATVFSPASRSYKVTLSDPSALLQVLLVGEEDRFTPAETGKQLVMEKLPMAMWSSRSLESMSGLDLGGHLKADLQLTGTVLTGTVRNDTGISLSDCTLVWGNQSAKVGNLGKGRSANINFDYTAGHAVQSYLPENEKKLERKFRWFAERSASRAGKPVLLAMSKRANLFGITGHNPRTEAWTCYAFSLDFTMGNEFSLSHQAIPGRVVTHSDVDESNTRKSTNGVAAYIYPNGWLIASYTPSIPVGSKVTEMKLVQGSVSSNHYGPGAPPAPGSPISASSLELSVYNHRTGTWDKAKPGKGLQDPERYLGVGNEIRVKIKAPSTYAHCWVGVSAKGRRG